MMNNKICNEDIVSHVYETLNDNDGGSIIISKDLIRDVVDNGQSLFTKHVIEKGMFEDIALKYFGKFKARHQYIQRMHTKLNTKNKK